MSDLKNNLLPRSSVPVDLVESLYTVNRCRFESNMSFWGNLGGSIALEEFVRMPNC